MVGVPGKNPLATVVTCAMVKNPCYVGHGHVSLKTLTMVLLRWFMTMAHMTRAAKQFSDCE